METTRIPPLIARIFNINRIKYELMDVDDPITIVNLYVKIILKNDSYVSSLMDWFKEIRYDNLLKELKLCFVQYGRDMSVQNIIVNESNCYQYDILYMSQMYSDSDYRYYVSDRSNPILIRAYYPNHKTR